MREPSTGWREVVAPDEDQRFASYAAQFAELQRRKSAEFGVGRALHRKQLFAARARLEVLADLPAHARHGLFAKPATFEALLRLSNGGTDRAPDGRPDVRGLAIKVMGVEGPGALGGDTKEQDFLLINHARFSFPKSDEFVPLAVAASRGLGALVKHMTSTYGFFAGLGRLREMGKVLGKPFKGFAAETMHSAAPIACGPYAAKVRLVPVGNPAPARDKKDWAEDFAARLANDELRWELQLQFFVDESVTPIEDASVEWPESESPFVTVARLSAPKQGRSSELAESIEGRRFDPWNALLAHKPLGDVMRARKVVYYESQKGRGLA